LDISDGKILKRKKAMMIRSGQQTKPVKACETMAANRDQGDINFRQYSKFNHCTNKVFIQA
jgi:hypothetical protein